MLKLIFLALISFVLFGSWDSQKEKEETNPARGKKLPYYEGPYKEKKNEHMDTESSK
tara:strand:- start:5511 stop:5681 length:171 start_codon:yes stop_codon:yes gene_type:complete